MCGINGHALAGDEHARAETVARMNAALHHRGPDEGGAVGLGWCALGMRRLAIVDLEHGAQPMATEDGRYTLVYNGETYDHRALRDELRRRGADFRTRSDTEVVLRAWAADGEACLPRLNGMYAFAVADRDERSLTLVRDPVGIKPLHYWISPQGELVFSSELASLLAHPAVPRRVDRRSLGALLVDRCLADPWTLLEGVRQLPPGHLLRWRDGRVEVRRYWSWPHAPEQMDEADALAELRARLDEAVRSQLVADVPVGVFLSGGVDSSTVAAFAARASEVPLHSFSVGFADPVYDESGLARAVAAHLGTEHHELRVEDARFELELLDAIVDHVGQPLADLSCIPTLLVSRFAREHVKVALSGDGGDELFGGYDHVFWAARIRRASERTPAAVRRLGQALLAGVAPVARGGVATATRRARKGLALSFREPQEQLRRLMSLWSPEEARALLGGAAPAGLRAWLTEAPAAETPSAPEEEALRALAQTYLPAAILAKVDRMSMAASLEVRVPLLDRRIVELAARVPLAHKIRGRVGKHLLREVGRPLLPAAVYRHRKQGFTLPIQGFLNAGFWELLEELYRPGAPAAGLFERARLDETLAAGRGRESARASRQAAGTRAWTLALLGRWMQRFEVQA